MDPRAIKRIVVGVDGSPHAAAAMRWAIAMAKGMGPEVIAVFAISPPVYYDTGLLGSTVPMQYDETWRAGMKREFEDEWCAPLRESGVQYRTLLANGRAASVIGRVADEVDAEIVLVGRRGRGGVAELLLGSVSHELVLHSKRPVLVISGTQAN